MLIRRPADLVALIRARRHELGMSQTALAEAIGSHRNWVSKLERGSGENAALGLILHALDVLQVDLAGSLRRSTTSDHDQADVIDLDALLRDMQDDR